MPKKSQQANPFQGRWRITWMEQWDQDFVDEEVEGYFEFKEKGNGSFQFGYVWVKSIASLAHETVGCVRNSLGTATMKWTPHKAEGG